MDEPVEIQIIRRGRPPVPKRQADAVLSQANPVSGTKYTVLDTVYNARIISIAGKVTWTVQPTPLQFHVTIDGQTIIYNQTDPVSTTFYLAKGEALADENNQLMETGTQNIKYRPFIEEGQSIKIEAEITGGTVSALDVRVKYAKW